MKGIPKFCLTIVVIGDSIHVYPTAYGSSYLIVSTKMKHSVKELRANLESYVERIKTVLL